MRFYATSGSAARTRTDCAIVGLYDSGTLTTAAAQLDDALAGRLTRLIRRGDVRGKPGETALLDADGIGCARVLVIGLGRKERFRAKQYRKAVQTAASLLAKTNARDAVSYLSTDPIDGADAYYRARLAVEGVGHALYRVPAIRRVAASMTAWKIGPAPVTPEESRSGVRSKLPTQTPTVTSRVYPIVQLSW